MKKLSFLILLALGITFMQSCQKDDINGNDQEAPKIPSQETFIMPFDGFDEEIDTLMGSNTNPNSRSATFKNWFFAGTNVFAWNTAVVLTTAIPVASFAEAFNHDPVHIGSGVYAWSYDFPVAGVKHTAKLTGEIINSGADVQWIMTISKSGGFNDIVFYTGVVAIDQSKATWTLNHQPNNLEPFLNIEYNGDASTGVASLRYTNIIPGSPDNGNYIEYRVTPGSDFNRAYDIYKGSANEFIEIQWDAPSIEGRVKNPEFFGDSEWHCWDTNQIDIDC